jgi:hypothetical protein
MQAQPVEPERAIGPPCAAVAEHEISPPRKSQPTVDLTGTINGRPVAADTRVSSGAWPAC